MTGVSIGGLFIAGLVSGLLLALLLSGYTRFFATLPQPRSIAEIGLHDRGIFAQRRCIVLHADIAAFQNISVMGKLESQLRGLFDKKNGCAFVPVNSLDNRVDPNSLEATTGFNVVVYRFK